MSGETPKKPPIEWVKLVEQTDKEGVSYFYEGEKYASNALVFDGSVPMLFKYPSGYMDMGRHVYVLNKTTGDIEDVAPGASLFNRGQSVVTLGDCHGVTVDIPIIYVQVVKNSLQRIHEYDASTMREAKAGGV